MRVTLGNRDIESLLLIATALRPADKEEIFATRLDSDPLKLAMDTFHHGDFQWIAYHGNRPVASIGAAPCWPGVWTVWAFGTEEWPRVALTLTKHIKHFMLPALVHAGAHKAFCHVLATHAQARRWLERLGAEPEAELDEWGKMREKFVVYSWRQDRTP